MVHRLEARQLQAARKRRPLVVTAIRDALCGDDSVAAKPYHCPLLQELPEVRHVFLDLVGVGKLHPALLKLALGIVSRSLQLLLTVPQRQDAGRQDLLGVSSLVSMAS